MSDAMLLGPWVRRFLLEYVVRERNLARNTQRSYRDAIALLVPFITRQLGKGVDRLLVTDVSADLVRLFLHDVEETRGCSVATRNQRLAAIHALAGFIGAHSPEHIAWCTQVRLIPFKRTPKTIIPFLGESEINAMLDRARSSANQDGRDYALLLFLYNLGARVSEAAQLRIEDLNLIDFPRNGTASVRILGKGGKVRACPLWAITAAELIKLTAGRSPKEPVFLNRRGQPLTRYGVYKLVRRLALRTSDAFPSIKKKRVSPHTVRHTAATHLLRSGVDINTIRHWLGHVSVDTTNIYVELDLEMKAKTLAKCAIDVPGTDVKPWRDDAALMAFLRSL